ncbi:MAG: indolepyruvate ferredoxin oxidoreductase family protein, partial [Pseudomonadota bacterium]
MTKPLSLDDKYTAEDGSVFMTGTQALVRLPMTQVRRDRAAGLDTAAFVTGYRGSPLGAYDMELARARRHLERHDVVFQPGVNEELAATAIWGTQQVPLSKGARKDGVVGLWYGKGPGVDRCGDVFKHANAAGTSPHGGVLALAGDDHACKSSTVPHQSDHAFMAALIPVLYPSSVQEFLEMGLLGIAMSRYSGCWVGMKFISDTVETTGVVDLATEAHAFAKPDDFEMPPGGLSLRWPDPPLIQDERLQEEKGYAAIAFARANGVDQVTLDSARARYGIVASGKAYEDVRQALRELEIGEDEARAIGLRLYKVRMPWPLEPEGIRHFSEGLEEVFVVEERREIIENQIKQQLFNWRADVRPRIVGKFDEADRRLLSHSAMLTVGETARMIARRILPLDFDEGLKARIREKLTYLEGRKRLADGHTPPILRTPYYCSGCPHNTSTKVPEGSKAMAGIGCHYMVTWMDRDTETFTQMGGEGVPWTAIQHFTDEAHRFVNLGDGTYFHSGLLAIRASVAAKANITYKVLYNDAVAMTGGQSHDGALSPAIITHQLHAEGVAPLYLLSDRPEVYDPADLAPGTTILHRDELDRLMVEIRETPGTSAIVYEQTCAAEKRRRRKRGLMEDPAKRVFINPAVCEGCGDCSVQSNCVSVEPVETPMGRKRRINQSTCNKDYSCLKGFCPSFVTVHGGQLKKRAAQTADASHLPQPMLPDISERPWNIAITGVGGTGVLTIGAILGMAAHLDGRAPMILDMAGLAQKGGAVLSHVRIGRAPEDVSSPRIVNGGADLLLAADDVVAASKEGITLCRPERTVGVVNTALMPVADFVRARDLDFRRAGVERTLRKALG